MSEELDIYDASLRPLGKMDRDEVHRTGQWHRTFHCWIVDITRLRILFQTRSLITKTHPGKLDISAAGHLAAGESVADGVREIAEELGITVTVDDLISAGERVEVSDSPSGIKNREYQSVYFLTTHHDLFEFSPDPSEVAGLAALPIAEAIDLFSGRVPFIEVDTVSVEANGSLIPGRRRIEVADFIPRIQRYYLAATIAAERVSAGKRDIAIS